MGRERVRIRGAKFGDIPSMMGILHAGHERSIYAENEEIDDQLFKSMLMAAINRQNNDAKAGKKGIGSCFVAVADNEGDVEGFIWAHIQPLYLIGKAMEASDLFWLVKPGANRQSHIRLLRAFHKWVPDGAFITQGATDVIGDPEKTGRAFERAGMRRSGVIYQKQKEASL